MSVSWIPKPPPGVVPNYINPPTDAPKLYVISYVFFGVTTLGVIARLYTVAAVMKKIHLEDYFLVIGWLGVLAFVILSIPLESITGRHIWDVDFEQGISLITIFNAVCISYVPTMVFLKLAILFQFKRIFTGPRRNLTWLSFQALIWLNPLFFAIILVFTSARCIPLAKKIDPNVPGVCFSLSAVLITTSCFNTLFDFLVLSLPLYIISRLSITMKQKFSILAVFAVGFLGCISSAFRIYFTEKLISEKDITLWILPIGFTADLEFFSALLVACLPVMPALYQHIRSKIAARRSRSQSRPKPQSNLRNIWPQDKPTPIPAEPSNSAGDFAPQPPPKDSGTKETQQTWLATDNTPVIREQRPLMEARETAAGAGPGCCRRRREREGG